MERRPFLKLGLFGVLSITTKQAQSEEYQFNFSKSKQGYINRIQSFKKSGVLPIIDIESSFDAANFDARGFMRAMDQEGIAQTCLSADPPRSWSLWTDASNRLAQQFPEYFIPTGNGGNYLWSINPERFLDSNEKNIIEQKIPLMGEFEFRHYPSSESFRRGDNFRDVNIPIDGPLGHRLFSFSQKYGIPFQIHQEIEDHFLPPLERMLGQYPGAKVIWCHLAQIRFLSRSTIYSPEYLGQLLDRHSNLYIDTAFGGRRSIYPGSGEPHARYWANQDSWDALIISKPYRFLAALDLESDRTNRVGERVQGLRNFLRRLPTQTAEIVAYKAAWKLLFNEDIA